MAPSALVWQEVPPGVALEAVSKSAVTALAQACAPAAPQRDAAVQDATAIQVAVVRCDSALRNQAPVQLGAGLVVVDCAAVAHSAVAELQPDGSVEQPVAAAAAPMAAQKAGSAVVAHSAAEPPRQDGSVEQPVAAAAAPMEAQTAGSAVVAHFAVVELHPDGAMEQAVPAVAARMEVQMAGFVEVERSAAAEPHSDGSVVGVVPGAAALMAAQQDVAPLPVEAALAQEFPALRHLGSRLAEYPSVAPQRPAQAAEPAHWSHAAEPGGLGQPPAHLAAPLWLLEPTVQFDAPAEWLMDLRGSARANSGAAGMPAAGEEERISRPQAC